MRARRDIEHNAQTAFVRWLRWRGIFCFAIPNGGARNAITGKRLKDEGVLAGVPDLFIPEKRLFIEMKSPSGKLSRQQEKCLATLAGLGYRTAVCRSIGEAIDAVEKAMGGEA